MLHLQKPTRGSYSKLKIDNSKTITKWAKCLRLESSSSSTFEPKIFLKPLNEEEVVEYLRKYGEKARLIAGGTGIYEIARRGLISGVEVLIDITGLRLSYIKKERDLLKIGACTTMSKMMLLSSSPSMSPSLFSEDSPLAAIGDALSVIQPLQVKNVATIGGAICTALPFFDLPVALLSLDSIAEISPTRREKVENLLTGYFNIDLKEGEFLREILIPLPDGYASSSFLKFAITGDDWALLNCGCAISLNESQRISSVSLVYGGGVGEKPRRAIKTQDALKGLYSLDEESIKRVFETWLHEDLETISDSRASAEYRMELAKVLGRRAVIKSAERASRRMRVQKKN